MNKQKFVEYLRSPDHLNEEQFEEVQQLLVDHPYFSIAKSIAAIAAKKLDNDTRGKLITSAAIFATDRKHLKKYINGELIFLDAPAETGKEKEKITPSVEETPPPSSTEPDLTNLSPPSVGDVDQILDELQHDMNALKKSREHFVDIQNQIDDEGSSVSEKKEIPSVIDKVTIPKTPEDKEDTTISTEEVSPEKDNAISKLVIDLEALKKEFQEEEETNQQKEIDKTDTLEESSNFSAKNVIEEIKKEEGLREEESEKNKPKAVQEEQVSGDQKEKSAKDETDDLIEIYDEEDIEDLTEIPEAPKPSGAPINVVTNMSEGEENDEGEPGIFDEGEIPEQKKPVVPKKEKLPARANRDIRKKVKRSDLNSLMGLKSVPKYLSKKPILPPADELKKEESKSDEPKAADKAPESKKDSPAKSKTQTEKKTNSATAKTSPEKKTTAKKSTTTKKAAAKRSKTSSDTSKSARHIGTPKIEEDVKTESTHPKTKAGENLGSDPVTKATRKAMLDFGKSKGLSMSVSRASPSKRKRSRSGNSKSQDTTKSGGKNDDESGGVSSIIDKFLEENPSIKRKVLSDKEKDLSEESTKFQDEIASEYLAEIYTKQGNKLRAIKIYENLSLKFPEKKSYFADLIQKLT